MTTTSSFRQVILSSQNQMLVEFHTDETKVAKGFKLKYKEES